MSLSRREFVSSFGLAIHAVPRFASRRVGARVAGGRGRGRGGAAMLNGAFTARLTVNGEQYTQTFKVKPGPRRCVS
jgi:hypothetical protein